MKKMVIAMCLIAGTLCAGIPAAQAQDDVNTKIVQIMQQVEDLQKQLDELKKAQAEKPAPQEDVENLKSTVQTLKDTLTEPEGAVQTTMSDVGKLKKIKISGYVQARYESYEAPTGVADKGDNKAPDNRFYVRRGRFKITGQPTDNTLGIVQLDICGYDRAKVETKDLYLEYHPWGVGSPAPFYVRLGQQNMPFGYAIERSSSAREVPERPKIFAGTTVSLPSTPSFSGLFPGERDKGICLLSTEMSKLDWALACSTARAPSRATQVVHSWRAPASLRTTTRTRRSSDGCATRLPRICTWVPHSTAEARQYVSSRTRPQP